MIEYELVTINGKEYPMKFVNRVLTRALRKHNIPLSEFQSRLSDLDFLYEIIFQSIRYASVRYDVAFEFKDDFESFSYELDDAGDEALESCLDVINGSYDVEDDGVEDEKKSEEAGK